MMLGLEAGLFLASKTSFRRKWVSCPLFLLPVSFGTMTHPLTPRILELATPVAESIGLEVAGAVFHTNQRPPVLRLDIRNPSQDTSLEDCERMSRAFEPLLDVEDLIPDAYVLEVSSVGVSSLLTTDRDFISFKGFPVTVTLHNPLGKETEITGQLVRRDDEQVCLNRKGRAIAIPRDNVQKVQLSESSG